MTDRLENDIDKLIKCITDGETWVDFGCTRESIYLVTDNVFYLISEIEDGVEELRDRIEELESK